MSALSQTELWLIDAILGGRRRGRGQPALRCLHREIASKRPAARVKKILHSGSVQMNPGGAWNCFQWHSSQYIITQRNFSHKWHLQMWVFLEIHPAWYSCLYSHTQGVTSAKYQACFSSGTHFSLQFVENNPPILMVSTNFVPSKGP